MKNKLSLLVKCLGVALWVAYPPFSVLGYAQSNTTQDTGIALWGESIFIANTSDTLGIFADLYLLNAKVQGNGVLVMTAEQNRRIVARQSSVPTLIIDNPDTVTLVGDLLVLNELQLQRGVFDTRQAKLSFTDTAWLSISPGALLCTPTPPPSLAVCWVVPFPLFPLSPPSQGFWNCWGLVSTGLFACSNRYLQRELRSGPIKYFLVAFSKMGYTPPDPPPRCTNFHSCCARGIAC